MISLSVFLLSGVVLFILVFLVALQTTPEKTQNSAALIAVFEIVKLDSLTKTADRILDDTEYRLLRSDPALTALAKQFRKERRTLALMWVALLLSDVRKLSRFRAFLIRSGLPVRAREEIEIFYRLACSVAFLRLLKAFILIAGPFALHNLTRRARASVEGMSRASATLLSRLPTSQWQNVARNWEITT